MKRTLGIFTLGFLFVLIQTSLWPHLLPFETRPDLILVLVVYLALSENHLSGGILAYLLGACLDAMAGSHPGLHGVTLLLLFFCVRFAADHFNTESSRLLIIMVGFGTLFYAGLQVVFASFADAGEIWLPIVRAIVPQILLNVVAALVLLKLVPHLLRRHVPRGNLATRRRKVRTHGA